jgi:hypothetical protein
LQKAAAGYKNQQVVKKRGLNMQGQTASELRQVQLPKRVILPYVLPEGATIYDAPGRCSPSDKRVRDTKKGRPAFAIHSTSNDKIFSFISGAAYGMKVR